MSREEPGVWLTIVTPAYRAASSIVRCIEAVASQGAEGVEHLIVDNASDDGTPEIARQCASRFPHLRVVSEPDRGQSDAMNKGVRLARGSVIGMLNADDWYEPDILARLRARFAHLPEPAMLIGNCAVRDGEGRVSGMNCPARCSLRDWLAGRPYPWNSSAYFYHRALHASAGEYLVGEEHVMDLDFLLRAARVAKLVYVDEHWGNFSFAPGTKTFGLGEAVHGRVDRVRRQYLAQAPPALRWQVAWIRRMDAIGSAAARWRRRWSRAAASR